MAEIPNRPNPLNQYSVITTKVLTATTSLSGSIFYVAGATFQSGGATGISTITGSTLKTMGPSGSFDFADLWSATGSIQTNVGLKVNITGSTYCIPVYSTA